MHCISQTKRNLQTNRYISRTTNRCISCSWMLKALYRPQLIKGKTLHLFLKLDPKKANTHSLGLLFPPWQREDSVFLTPLKLSLCTKAECPEATKAQDQALRAMMLKDGRTQEPATPRNKAKCRVRKAGHCEDRLFGKKTTAVPAASSVEYPISGSHG